MTINDRFNLERFITAQEGAYRRALAELKAGQKSSHWIWFIFPQVKGLGRSSISELYAIRSEEEAHGYLNHPILGARLRECTEAIWAIEEKSALEILGYPDDLKFKSSMTLFDYISEPGSIFARALDKYFGGKRDGKQSSF
jgi:uncharacterized protein (DUF1810 family)